MPKFLLMTSICRSPAVGTDDDTREAGLLHHLQQNAYPIYVEKADRMRFRYMRYWIETGFRKSGLPCSPLLRVAMDMLDAELDQTCIFNQVMQPGEMAFC